MPWKKRATAQFLPEASPVSERTFHIAVALGGVVVVVVVSYKDLESMD